MTTESRRISLKDFTANAEAVVRGVLSESTLIVIEDERGREVILGPVVSRLREPRVVESTKETTQPPTLEEVERTLAGINRAAGGWEGLVDAEMFKGYLRERRRTETRPPVRF